MTVRAAILARAYACTAVMCLPIASAFVMPAGKSLPPHICIHPSIHASTSFCSTTSLNSLLQPLDIATLNHHVNHLPTSVLLARGSSSLSDATPPSEGITLTVLAAGFALIVYFLVSEFAFLTTKKDEMTKANTNEKDVSWRDLIDYRLDYFFSTSEFANVILLLGLSYLLVVIGAGLLVVGDADDYASISEAAWTSWTYVVDPGAQADAPSELIPRTVSLIVTLGGLLVFALLIGIVGESIGEKLDDLKTGKSRVFESGHTLMLNWNDKSLAVIRQIALANESEGGGVLVVLSQLPKEEMEERLNDACNAKENPLDLLGTEVIFRQGSPIQETDLKKVSATTARACIALTPPDLKPDEADANMLRQVLALKALDNDFGKNGRAQHCVVELQDIDNEELIHMVAPDVAEVICNHDMIGRLMLQCARTPELAFVLDSMMGFEGSEFYFDTWPELYGKTFYEITCRFDDAIPVGFRSSDGTVYLNPENDMLYNEGDEILVLAEDDDTYQPNDGTYSLSAGECSILSDEECLVTFDETRAPEKILFCGWRRDMADLISQLDDYVPEGSEVWLFNTIPACERRDRLLDGGNKEELKLKNLTVKNAVGSSIIRRDLNRIWDIDCSGNETGDRATLIDFDSMLILSDETANKNGEKGSTSSDSRSLASVLIIQDMMDKLYERKKKSSQNPESVKPPCIPVSEILDSRTKSLLSVANCRGYVMSNQIISSVMAQVAEEKDINVVLTELFSATGSETYIRPIERFLDLDKTDEMSFWDVALKARQRREVAVGYKPKDASFAEVEDLIINPPNKASPIKWSPGDKIITFSLEA